MFHLADVNAGAFYFKKSTIVQVILMSFKVAPVQLR